MDTIRFASWSVIAALQSQRNKGKEKKKSKRQHKLVVNILLFLLLFKHICFYLISKDGK